MEDWDSFVKDFKIRGCMSVINKILFFFFLILASCTSTSFKEKTFRNMLFATTAGIAIGQSESESKTGMSLVYAGSLASMAAIISILAYDPDKEISERRKTSQELAKQIDSQSAYPLKNQSYDNSVLRGPGINNLQSLPEKYRSKFIPGEWTLYNIDEWEQVDETRIVHKTEMFEIKPPKFLEN